MRLPTFESSGRLPRIELELADLRTTRRLNAFCLEVPKPGRRTWPPYQQVGEHLMRHLDVERKEKAHGPFRGPYQSAKNRKVRKTRTSHREIDEYPWKWGFDRDPPPD